MSLLFIDAETYSELDLKEVGSRRYAEHPSTEVIFWSVFAETWATPLVFDEPNIWKVLLALKQANRIEWSKNEPLDLVSWGSFDREIAANTPLISGTHDDAWITNQNELIVRGPNNTCWLDAMVVSRILGGPEKLEQASVWWTGRENEKLRGSHLITRFCKPNSKTGKRITAEQDEVRFAEFRAYASRDTEVLLPILDSMQDRLDDIGVDPQDHGSGWRIVERMNDRGVPIDRESAKRAQHLLTKQTEEQLAAFKQEFGFSPTQVARVTEYLGLPNAQRETLEEFLLTNPDPLKRKVAEARLLVGGAAIKKLKPMILRSTDEDPRVFGTFVYCGAQTRRLTSKGIQGQNFVRSASSERFFEKLRGSEEFGPDIFEQVKTNLRGFICAPPGKALCAADYNAIETRVAAWLAEERWLLDRFAAGEDPYLEMASDLYGEPITDKKDPRRQFGKIVILACQYQLGPPRLQQQAASQGLELTDYQAERAVRVYRAKSRKIEEGWKACQDCFETLVEAPAGTSRYWNRTGFMRSDEAIVVVRPSGFIQAYWLPHLKNSWWPNGEPKVEIRFSKRLSAGMYPSHTYGGDIFQSIVQGTAADILMHGMAQAEEAGFPLIMSIHDEVVSLVDEGTNRVDELCKTLCDLPSWAEGLPVEAEGWQQKRFTK